LLSDDSAATFASWLEAHPGVEIIAGDRAGTFAEGARQGAPDGIQVADRFHLMQNLRTAIEEILKQMVDVRQVAAEALAEQTTQHSTGPVEGNINRLKLIKRSGYGRAGFDLLRLRVLAA
jgi:transposase